jgi:hypothetical protein
MNHILLRNIMKINSECEIEAMPNSWKFLFS